MYKKFSKNPFIKNYQKSQLQIRQYTSSLRMLPHFIIFGVARGGTTSLYNYLTAHSNIASATLKEIGFFDYEFNKGINYYRTYFPSFISKYFKKNFVTGEATPSYMHHPLVPSRIKETLPNVKLIALLRNPVERAYSHYYQAVRAGRETLPFEVAIKHQIAERACFEEGNILGEAKHVRRIYHPHAYLSKGIYIDHLRRWLDVFPRQQILFLKSEELYTDPQTVLQNTLEFLELPQWTLAKYEKYNAYGQHFALVNSAKTNAGKKSDSKEYEKMDSAVRQQLVDYFKPYNEQLYELLGVDFDWDN
ncbi:sulfotransferase domain-containing protein [Candidatus Parabeggiatoa sp. HSG14]|uniref:sulfotransferase domain-containing protein n=1 Tax=Candidatus Parabeggiatoa sp. HSG14 TaxID=3055593 RepID=UPI0025A8A784|nr:sulfotransferase domain-containing protein [Thiotrichales bacterium HSG14]